eukprot:gene9593-10580_t
MQTQRKLLIYSSIQQHTEEGHESLKKGDLEEASKHFSTALEKAKLYQDDFTTRACAFNLGSCLVAFGQPNKGLEYLEYALPPSGDESDGIQNFADLEYNIGIAKHALGDLDHAVEAYSNAVSAYKKLDNIPMQVETYKKLAVCYQSLKELQKAAASYKTVAELYEQLGEQENRCIALSSLTSLLAELKDIKECSENLKILLGVCQEMDNAKLKGKIYHDIGMLYSSEKCYTSAYECFDQSYHALQEVPIESKDKTLEAVVLLNMGVSLNHISLFGRAMIFHQMAVNKFGELEDLKSQSQAFYNLAFAHSQTDDHIQARWAFSQAIQHSQDCDDTIGQCLATEGLAAIHFRERNYQNAIDSYKDALVLVAKTTGEESKSHSDRIASKLAQAVEYQLKENRTSGDDDDVDGRNTDRRFGRRRKGKGKPKYGKVNSLVAKGLEPAKEDGISSSTFTSGSSSTPESDASDESKDRVESSPYRPGYRRDNSGGIRDQGPRAEVGTYDQRNGAPRNGQQHLRVDNSGLLEASAEELSRDNGIIREELPKNTNNQNVQSKTCVIQ